MKQTLAFDVYGTLIDTHGVLVLLKEMVADKALLFSNTWRSKQLEYTFRRGLMKSYENFPICTRDALNYTCDFLQLPLTQEQKQELLESYKTLPAYDDVTKALSQLQKKHQLVAFSNGTREAVEGLLSHANIRDFFSDVISADEIKTFKPNPDIYHHLLNRTGSLAESTWLISSNPFDIIGAKSIGLNAAWVKRTNAEVFDPWQEKPNMVITYLDDLVSQLG